MADKLWFKRKKYGWGWTPITIEGWAVTLAIIGYIISVAKKADENLWIKIIIATAILIIIAYKKGPKPKWQWG